MSAVARPVTFWPIPERRLVSLLRGRTGSFCSTKAFLLQSRGVNRGPKAHCERGNLRLGIVKNDKRCFACSASPSIRSWVGLGEGIFSALSDRLESGAFTSDKRTKRLINAVAD